MSARSEGDEAPQRTEKCTISLGTLVWSMTIPELPSCASYACGAPFARCPPRCTTPAPLVLLFLASGLGKLVIETAAAGEVPGVSGARLGSMASTLTVRCSSQLRKREEPARAAWQCSCGPCAPQPTSCTRGEAMFDGLGVGVCLESCSVQPLASLGKSCVRSEFKWNDVKTDKFRENYLGHSLLAPVGRWQKSTCTRVGGLMFSCGKVGGGGLSLGRSRGL